MSMFKGSIFLLICSFSGKDEYRRELLLNNQFRYIVFLICRIFTLFYLLIGTNGTILRLPCSTIADFSVQHSGKRLKNHVIRTDYEINDVQCMVKCIELKTCRSYNINTKNRICELNGKAHVDEGAELASDGNWMYKTTNFDSKLVSS